MKTGAWLRGGRGKIAGMVAQKSSDGKGTVLREHVVPKNPQTVDQMATRLAFGTITQAASIMLPIIGQTFLSASDEKMNRRRFVALNVTSLKAKALASYGGDNNVVAAFRGKSTKSIIPNEYIMSEGSLLLNTKVVPTIDDGSIVTKRFDGDNGVQLTAGQTYNPADILASWIGFKKNQQLTFVAIGQETGQSGIEMIEPNTGDFVRNAGFIAYRINLNPEAADFVYTAQTTVQQLKDYIRSGFNIAKTTAVFIDAFIDTLEITEQGLMTSDTSLAEIADQIGSLLIVAAASIISELNDGKWNYSNSKLVCLPASGDMVTTNSQYYGLRFSNALIDYIGVDAASKLFTRKGGLINEF